MAERYSYKAQDDAETPVRIQINTIFEHISDELLAKFKLYLIGKVLSNGYVFKSMKDIKTFLN